MLFLYKKEMVRFFYLRMFFTYNLKTEMFHGRRVFYLRVFFLCGVVQGFFILGCFYWRGVVEVLLSRDVFY